MRELEGWLDSKWSNDRHQVIESGKFMFFFWGVLLLNGKVGHVCRGVIRLVMNSQFDPKFVVVI